MRGRIILLGATGFTGRLTAEALTRAGAAPVLAGRSADRLVELVADLAPGAPLTAAPTWQQADATDPDSVRALIRSRHDVLVTTVGPFSALGGPALAAAIEWGCGYVDSTGEPAFIRDVFEKAGPAAERTGARLLTACGYDYLPGNLAAALAIRDAEDAGLSPYRVEVGYFVRGGMSMSSGTKASVVGMIGQRPFSFRQGRITYGAEKVASFAIGDRQWSALPIGSSEHFTVPRMSQSVREVGAYLGWAGRFTGAAHSAMTAAGTIARMPLLGKALTSGLGRMAPTATGEGPSAHDRASSVSIATARVLDPVGRELTHATVQGPTPYDLTAELLAWSAAMLVTEQARGVGALGPVDAFGLDALTEGCAAMGLVRVD